MSIEEAIQYMKSELEAYESDFEKFKEAFKTDKSRWAEESIKSIEKECSHYRLAVQALQQMRTERCHYCKGIESHDIDKVKVVIDKLGRWVDAYNTPYNYCPNCGRKLR